MTKTTVFRLLKVIATGIFLAIFTQIFLVSPARVSGASMLPTLTDRSYVILSKISHTFNCLPSYGDIVAIDSRIERNRSIADDISEPFKNGYARIFHTPPSRDIWIKRVIGLPGDYLEIKDGHLYRNSEIVIEPYILEPMRREIPQHYTVPEGTVFVLGDNRNHSVDSREIGAIPISHLLGTVMF